MIYMTGDCHGELGCPGWNRSPNGSWRRAKRRTPLPQSSPAGTPPAPPACAGRWRTSPRRPTQRRSVPRQSSWWEGQRRWSSYMTRLHKKCDTGPLVYRRTFMKTGEGMVQQHLLLSGPATPGLAKPEEICYIDGCVFRLYGPHHLTRRERYHHVRTFQVA